MLILASTSPARRGLLDAAGLPYTAVAPAFEEVHPPHLAPEELARWLARGKARSVAAVYPKAIVVGADQVVAFEGEIWGKPADAQEALAQLQRLRGRTHQLITGLAVVEQAGHRERILHATTDLVVRADLTDRELERYVATGEWQGCAGGYRVEGRGLALFAAIRGDYHNILGLPMVPLLTVLREWGVALFA